MIYFIRDKRNNTIIECSVSKDDLRANVDIRNYTMQLFEYVDEDTKKGIPYLDLKSKALAFATSISELSEIRGWWWEGEKDFGDWDSIENFVGVQFTNVSVDMGLFLVTD